MKKYILYIGLLFAVLVHAQEADTQDSDVLTFQKGSQFVNTNFAFTLRDEEFRSLDNLDVTNVSETGLSIRASYAYSVVENLFLGVGLSYQNITRKIENSFGTPDDTSITNGYGVFPFVRYYKGIGKKLALYLQAEASVRYSKIETTKANSFSTGLRPGVTFLMNKNLALEASLGFLGYFSNSTDNEESVSESDSDGFQLSLNSSNLLFGLNYYF
ncbi:MAG: hypothetical protein AAF617_07180 [Bacteroidota bacterium]